MITDDKQALEILVDVTALSKRLCEWPIITNLAYATHENFVGKIIDGYNKEAFDICLMTKLPALALCEIQNYLLKKNLSLYIYDSYRPLRSVKYFAKWFVSPVIDNFELERKKIHYPNIHKNELAKLGYVLGDTSRHNFGYAVDLGLISTHTNKLLPMGACFDYFDQLSHTNVTTVQIGEEAYNHREFLSSAMQKYGFIPYEKEFWHFDFHQKEVEYPIDLEITKKLKNINAY